MQPMLATKKKQKNKCISLCVLPAQPFISWCGSSALKIPLKEPAQENAAKLVLAGWTAVRPGAGEEGKKARLGKLPG